MTGVVGPARPSSRRFRLVLLWRALSTLGRVEWYARRLPPVELCRRFGVEFAGFTSPVQDYRPLSWDVFNAWWAVETVLGRWPVARERQCLRRTLVLGHLLRERQPALRLEVMSLSPFSAHAWLMVSNHGLDLGPAGAMVAVFDSSSEDRPR